MARWADSDRTPLAQIRANTGISGEKAAAQLGIVMATLYRYENGVTDIPLGVAENMATLYQIPFDEIREAARATKEAKNVTPKIDRRFITNKKKVIAEVNENAEQ